MLAWCANADGATDYKRMTADAHDLSRAGYARVPRSSCPAPAADGASAPISLLMRRGQALDGTAPLLLFGYDPMASLVPEFEATRLSLVERG